MLFAEENFEFPNLHDVMQHDDPNRFNIDWLIIGIIAFLGGIVSNLVVPARRGVLGFAAAGLVSIFTGFVAGVCANDWGASLSVQVLTAAVFGVLGNQILTYVLTCFHERNRETIINNYSDSYSQNNTDGSVGTQGGTHYQPMRIDNDDDE